MSALRVARRSGNSIGLEVRDRFGWFGDIARRTAMLLSLLAAAMLSACDQSEGEVRGEAPAGIDETLSGVRLQRIGGSVEELDRHLGKVVVLNVWATWCPPCRAELPSLQRLSDSLDPERYAVLGLSVDEDADFVREYLRDVEVDFANYLDSDEGVTRGRFGVESLPQTLLVRADGTVVRRIEGVREWDAPETRREIESLAR